MIGSVAILYVGYFSYLQYVWYKDHEKVKFHFYNDLAGYNQMDKFGHIYGSYVQSHIGFNSLLWVGLERNKAALYGGSIGFLMQLPIEVCDGMYEGWGFSWSDIGANAFGSALFIAQELIFQEQIIKYKFSFSPSRYAKQANGYLGSGLNQFLNDYNGHTYWLSTGIKNAVEGDKIPPWLNIAVGYSAGGMFGEFENIESYKGVEIPETQRYRQFLFSLDIDFSKIPTQNPVLKKVFNSLFALKMPFPALEINTKGQVIFHPLYF
jgi:hypothetical protein